MEGSGTRKSPAAVSGPLVGDGGMTTLLSPGSWGPSKGCRGGGWEEQPLALTDTLSQANVSLKRIQHFLSQDEIDPQCVERKTISPGLEIFTLAPPATLPLPQGPAPVLSPTPPTSQPWAP